jgi:hypothetical protein
MAILAPEATRPAIQDPHTPPLGSRYLLTLGMMTLAKSFFYVCSIPVFDHLQVNK